MTEGLAIEGAPLDEFGALDWAYTDRLVRLARHVRPTRPDLRPFWRLQLDLLSLQQDVQAAITRAKRIGTPLARQRTRELRETRAKARRLGDAMAWVLFGSDRSSIYALSYNAAVPILPRGGTAMAHTVIAAELASTLGFPLLHDITDILRVGDMTFFHPGKAPHTVEVKASVLAKVPVEKGTRISYQASVVWPAEPSQSEGVTSDERTPSRRRGQASLDSAQFRRQLGRMRAARDLLAAATTAQTGPAMLDGSPALILHHPDAFPEGQWGALKRLVAKARRSGYASGVIGDTTHYVVMQVERGRDPSPALMDVAVSDLAKSEVWYKDRERNTMVTYGMPDPRGPGPWRYRPFYLYPFPWTWIADMIRGRLMIMAFLNLERVAEALRGDGFIVPPLRGPRLTVRCEFEADERSWVADISLINTHVTEMVQEMLPLSYVRSLAQTAAAGISEHMPGFLEQAGRQRAARDTGRPRRT